jgi:SAM-dependent methyltransferase
MIVRGVWRAWKYIGGRNADRRRRRFVKVLASPNAPQCARSEHDFEILQERYQPRPEYGYDAFNIFKRACERAANVIGQPGLGTPGLRGLDLGTGDGMLSLLLKTFGHEMTLSDLEDWRVDAAKLLPFVQADCCDVLPIPDDAFDFVISFNAFEHFPDPRRALDELLRVTRAGGLMYFKFNPLYCSPWGLHAYRSLRMPYPQFLFSEVTIERKLDELGIFDLGKKRSELQTLNRWRPEQFKSLWTRPDVETISCNWHRDVAHLDLVLEYPECFCGRGLTLDDLVIGGVTALLRKR